MRKAVGFVMAVMAGALFAAFVAAVNLTVGVWFLHFIPVFWFTNATADGQETYAWPLLANIITWTYYIIYVVPTTLYAFTVGWNWSWRKTLEEEPEGTA